ncbi:two-component system sensor histidine kinase NtrB [Leptothermofonsia sp. ETS-13]|uniref:two-component system sensor histidine kinase NtrB n=1 Tax=Leptothermofonsia sp. ETS-13 TaxID=3035696 RepID=UPI003B9E93AB
MLQLVDPDRDEILVEWQVESYLGIALLDSTGRILGHLAVLDDKPMEDEPRNRAVLEIFAARAAAEMERQQAEAALRMSEEKFSKAFRSSPDAITISTLDNGCYVEMNDSCLRMLGYHREEMLGHSALELGIWAKPEDRDTVVRSLQEKGSVSKIELQFRKKSGEIFPALFSAEIIHLENEPCLLSVATDITALKQAEKALERLAEIGELAAMIVHEVRNPLTTISMSLGSFKRLDLPERYQEYLALASDESDRLQRLLNQILLYAKPQTFQPAELELNSFITDTLVALQHIPVAAGKQVQFNASPLPLKILADRDKLKQVLINLVTNAFEAIEAGVVAIATTNPTPNHACIQIHNDGQPIPSDILPKLTRPFFTTKSTGTGLGLAIVKRIVEAHGGELSIESLAFQGTIASVKLPLVSS